MALIKLSGNFIEVADKILPSSETFYAEMEPEIYLGHLEKDLDRTCYMSYHHSVDEIQHRLQSTDQLAGKVYSFSQGQITGALFTQVSTVEKRVLLWTCGNSDLVTQLNKEFCLTYIDDDGILCGLSVVCMVPYYELTVNNNHRSVSFPKQFASGQYPFSLCVVRNPVNTPSEIEVNYYIHPDMLCLDMLLKLAEDPQTMSFDEVRLLLKNQNGCILYAGELYAVDIIEKTIQRIEKPSPEKQALIEAIETMDFNQCRFASSAEDVLIAAVTNKKPLTLKKVNFNPDHDMVDGLTEETLRNLIHNDALAQALSGMVKGDTISIDHFKAFAARLHPDRNLDDRDHRQKNLEELIDAFKESFPYWPQLNAYISELRLTAKSDINFYRTDVFKEKINQIMVKTTQINGMMEANGINPLTLTRDAVLYDIELLENLGADDDTKLMWENAAKSCREKSDLLKSLHHFERRLVVNKYQHNKDIQKKLYVKGDEILNLVQDLLDSRTKLSHKEQVKLTEVLTCCSAVLDNPTDKTHIKKLNELSKETIGKEKPFWKQFGLALLVFAGLALVVVGVLTFVPTAGSSLIVSGFGTSAVTAGLTGLGFYNHGQAQGVAKSLTDFKNDLILLQKDEKNGVGSTGLPGPTSREDAESNDSVDLSDSASESPRF